MAYVNKQRPYKKEYKQQKARGEHENRMERQRARRAIDKKGISRKGKDVAHVKALSKGGSNGDGVRLESPSKNRSFPRKSSGAMK
jgi:precorrin-3B methylase